MSAHVFYHSPSRIGIRTPFNRSFVERLKASVPADYWEWSAATKTWFVVEPYVDHALRVTFAFFSDVRTTDGPTPKAPGSNAQANPSCGCSDDHRALHVCSDAPREVVDAAYRALAKTHHPDHGGHGDAMQRLNAAFSRLSHGVRS